MRPTVTREEAVDRVEQHLKQTVAQLPGSTRLTVARKTDRMPCGLCEDEDGDTRVRVEHGYWIDGIPKESNQDYFDAVSEYWADRGYRKVDFEKRERWIMYYKDSETSLSGLQLESTAASASASRHRACGPTVRPSLRRPDDVRRRHGQT